MDSLDVAHQSRTDAPSELADARDPLRPPRAEEHPVEVPMAGPSALFGRSLAVVIGVNAYSNGITPLRSAVADAMAIAQALRRDHGFETWCFLDEEVQMSLLLTLLRDKLPSMLGANDRLVFYFAGHGIALDSDAGPAGYLLPADAQRSDRDTFLPMRMVHDALGRLPVRHAFVILDCCFAGTFRWAHLRDVDTFGDDSSRIYRERYARYIESSAWQVLTSTSSDQRAFDVLANDRDEGAGNHSPFALALLAGLAGAADYTKDNVITADELALYVRERVVPAATLVGARQVPQLFALERHGSGQFVFQVPGRALELALAPRLDENANPYRGLEPFQEQHRALFFGRAELTGQLAHAVHARRLTVVVGPSGSGKSSLVQAGLLPVLRSQGWVVLPTQRPGREPLAVLNAWTAALGGTPVPGDSVASWVTAVTEHARIRPDDPWLVIVDQFEELLTYRTTERDRSAFLGALASALRVAPNLHVVVTVRSDTEPQFHRTALAPWWTEGRFLMRAMTRDELRQAIERPAVAAVLHFEPSRLVEQLLDDVALVPAPLPLLSFALGELYRCCWLRWQRGVRDRALHETDYRDMGSVAGALTRRANAVHDQLVAEDAAYETTIRNIFTRMVAVVGGEVARRRVPRSELTYQTPAENQRIVEALQRFHDARLVSLGRDENSGSGDSSATAYAEPTHDELVRGWTKVSQWLDEIDASVGTRALVSLGEAVRSWSEHGQLDSYLWNTPRVEQMNELAIAQPLLFNADEVRFVKRGAQLRRRQRARLLGGLASATVVLAIVAGAALWQRERASEEAQRAIDEANRASTSERHAVAEADRATKEADRATKNEQRATAAEQAERAQRIEAERLAKAEREQRVRADHESELAFATSASLVSRETGRELEAIILGLKAVAPSWHAGIDPPVDVLRGLQDALAHTYTWGATITSIEPEDVQITDDGRVLATLSKDKVRLWDATNGARLAELSGGASVIKDSSSTFPNEMIAVALAPDGEHVVTASVDEVQLWTGDGKTRIAVLPQTREHIRRLAMSADSKRVAVASLDAIRIIDLATGNVAAAIEHWGGIEGLAFSHDGTRIAALYVDALTRVWDTRTGALVASWKVPGTGVQPIALAPTATAALVHDGSDLRFVDLATGNAIVLASGPKPWRGTIDGTGTRAAVIGHLGDADVWSADGKHLLHLTARRGTFRNAWLSPDGTRLVTASDEGLAVWNVPDGKLIVELPDNICMGRTCYGGGSQSVAFGPGDTIASAGNGAHVWHANREGAVIELVGHQEEIVHVAFSPDGSTILTGSQDLSLRTWRARDGAPIGRQPATRSVISTPAFIAVDGSHLAGVTNWGVQVWSSIGVTEREIKTRRLRGAAFARDGRYAVGIGDAGGNIFDLATGQQVAEIHEVMGAIVGAVSPAGDVVATGGYDGKAALWSLPDGARRCRLDGRSGESEDFAFTKRDVSAIAFSPSSGIVAIGRKDGTISVRDARTCRERATFVAPGAVGAIELTANRLLAGADDTIVWDLATERELARRHSTKTFGRGSHLSSDGRIATSLTASDEIELWEAGSGRLFGSVPGREAWATALSPDGTQLVVAGRDKTARIYRMPAMAPVAAACRILVRYGELDTAKQLCSPADLR